MALAEKLHHSAQRPMWPGPGRRGTKRAKATKAPPPQTFFQERAQLRTVEHIADVVPMVQILDFPVMQMENQLVEMCPQFDILISEQAVEVPKISSSSRLSCRRRVLRLPQTAEQLVEVSTIVSVSSLRALVEQNEDIPVPRGRGGLVGRRGLQSFSQGR